MGDFGSSAAGYCSHDILNAVTSASELVDKAATINRQKKANQTAPARISPEVTSIGAFRLGKEVGMGPSLAVTLVRLF
jgi:hypothetical protein